MWINLVAAKHTLNRGKVLNKQDLEYKSVDLGKHRHQGETDIDQLVGLTVKREIDKGTVVSTRYDVLSVQGVGRPRRLDALWLGRVHRAGE